MRVIDSISEWSGKIISWSCVAVIVVLCYEVTARYVFDAPTTWATELARMLGLTISVMGWAYVHRYGGHVRVDVIYMRLSRRKQAIIDIVFFILFFVPLTGALLYYGFDKMIYSWRVGEILSETIWKPIIGPIRTIFVIGMSLFILQAVAQFCRDISTVVRRNKADD